jgi:hypothetical protein
LKNHWSTVFYRDIFRHISEEDFSVLYCEDNGRPNVPVNILAGLEILKELFQLTDERSYESFLYDLTFQRALGVEFIKDSYFSIRSLYNFRAKLAEYEYEGHSNPMMNVFKDGRDKIISDLGLNTSIQRTDSVMIGANIKRMNRLMLFHKVLANLVRELFHNQRHVSPEAEAMVKEDEDSIAYRLPSDEVNMTIRRIALMIYSVIVAFKNDEDIVLSDAYKKAVRLLEEQCTIKPDGRHPDLKLKDPKEISSGSMQNPADGDATYRKKNDEEYRGYSAHAVETCDKENPIQVITDIDLVENNKDDAQVLNNKLEVIKEETDLETIITDGGFHSPDVSQTAEELDVEIITTAIRGKKTEKEDILDTKAFHFEENGLISACPDGHRPIRQKLDKDKKLTASFDRRKCEVCHLSEKCIAYLSEKQSRLVVDSNRRWLDKRRSEIFNEDFKNLCRLRPAVEGLMEKIKPKYLKGRTMFRTKPRVKNRLILRAIGLNFKRYAKHISYFLKFIAELIQKYLTSMEAPIHLRITTA